MYSAGGSVPRNEFKLIRGTDFILGDGDFFSTKYQGTESTEYK